MGGILPAAGLTVPHVLERIRKQLGDALALSDVHQGSTYCQFTATATATATSSAGSSSSPTKPTEDPSAVGPGVTTSSASALTPLDLLRQHFHNVVWRGCKLKVEKAQLHFLDKLAAERTERGIGQGTAQQASSLEEELSSPPSCKLPRHLTLRRPVPRASSSSSSSATNRTRGRTTTTTTTIAVLPPPPLVAHIKVDTRPRLVADWSDFTRRLRKVREKSHKVTKPTNASTDAKASVIVLAPRALHLRLGVEATSLSDDDEPVKEEASDAGSMDFIQESVSTSGSETASSLRVNSHTERGAYVWSDDDDESNDDDDESRKAVIGIDVEPDVGTDLRHRHCQTTDGGDDDERDGGSSELEKGHGTTYSTLHQRASAKADDETDEKEEEEVESIVGEDRDDRPSPADPTDISWRNDDSHADVDGDALLLPDVASNLRILSQLFPDIPTKSAAVIPRTIPRSVDGSQHPVDESSSTDPHRASDTGWGRNGQMLRYDPNSPAARASFVLPDAPPPPLDPDADPNESRSVDSGNGGEGEVATSEETLEGDLHDNSGTPPSSCHLYEQQKLEAVFREARGEGVTNEDSRMAAAEGSSSFAFGFPVSSDPGPSNMQGPSAAFSFSFALPDAPTTFAPPEQSTMDGEDEHSSEGLGKDEEEQHTAERRPAAPKRRFGRAFTHEELHSHIAPFLRLGPGWTGTLDQWRHDESLKALWLKERATLTQDWKRKRKAAVARKKDRKSN